MSTLVSDLGMEVHPPVKVEMAKSTTKNTRLPYARLPWGGESVL